MRRPELLAPAGDFDSLKAAVYHGADAVYLGLSNFNARASAANFNKDTVREAVKFAHLYGVKVYITLNTLVKDAEIPVMLELAEAGVHAKADAFIVQDFGVVSVLKRCFPGICLHASTQMGIHNLYGAQIAEKLGLQRVVLSRETTLADIKEIKKNTNLEIEFFVQGALCVAFSGNCYMSALECNNSGNRGKCLQLCRLPYGAEYDNRKQKENYLLSPADLCLIDRLEELAESGVCAFKIEGRLRRAAYVAEAVNCYRKAIDEGFPPQNDEKKERLKKVFFRGDYLTRAYLDDGVPDRIINKDNQNHIGVPIGEVTGVRPFKDIFEIEIATNHPLVSGDGLKFFRNGREVGSIGVGNTIALTNGHYKVYGKVNPSPDAIVHLIRDKASEDTILAQIKKLPVTVKITALEASSLELTACCKGIEVRETSHYLVQRAENAPITPKEIIKQVSKTGDSVFSIARAEVEAGQIFIPKSVINETRRNLLLKLEKSILENAEKSVTASINTLEIDRIKKEIVSCRNPVCEGVYESFENGEGKLTDENIAVIYPSDFNGEETAFAVKDALLRGDTPCLRLPAMASGEGVRIIEKLLQKNKEIKTLLINNLYGFAFAERGYQIIAGWGLNMYNHFALQTVYGLGAEKAIKSVELKDGLDSDNRLYQFCGKGFPLMTLAHCPYKTLHGNTCEKCSYIKGLKYTRNQKTYSVVRHKLDKCYFEVIDDKLNIE